MTPDSWWRWLLVIVVTCLMVNELVGPISMAEVRRQGLVKWLLATPSRPRERLLAGDWLPNFGRLSLPAILTLGLLVGGAYALVSTSRHAAPAIFALLAGLLGAAALVLYIRRPIRDDDRRNPQKN